jgi:hypothetical protein
LLAGVTAAAAATGGNDFYTVTVEENPGGVGIGVYTFNTGMMHPVTGFLGAQNVLFGGGIPGTSYTTIRSYTSGTDYTQRNGLTLAAGAPPTLTLESFVLAGEEAVPIGDPLSPFGLATTYRPGAAAPAPDALTIAQSASVMGASFNTSAVQLETSITNNGAAPVEVGVRYLWDLQIGSGDDGPTLQPKDPDGAVMTSEYDAPGPGFDTYEVQDNNDPFACFGAGNSPFPFFSVRGSVVGPAALAPVPPTRLTYVAWPDASGLAGKFSPLVPAINAFEYFPSGVDTSTCFLFNDDSAVAYWWGDSAGTALAIPPGGTISVVAYIFAFLPGEPPDFTFPGVEGPPGDDTCSDGIDNDGDGQVDGDDPDCEPPPLPHVPEPGECLTRTQGFYGASQPGGMVLLDSASLSLGLPAGDPLLGIFPAGTLVPIDLGDGAFVFPDLVSIKGSGPKGAGDGGFLPGLRQSSRASGARNLLTHQSLTVALTVGLSLLGTDSLENMDLDGDGFPDDLLYATGLPDLIINNPGRLGDGMIVRDLLLLADAALAGGAGSVKPGELLGGFAAIPPGQPAEATIDDLIRVLTAINEACKLPDSPATGFLLVP